MDVGVERLPSANVTKIDWYTILDAKHCVYDIHIMQLLAVKILPSLTMDGCTSRTQVLDRKHTISASMAMT